MATEVEMTRSELDKLIRDQVRKAVEEDRKTRDSRLDGMTREVAGDDMMERARESRDRAASDFEQLATSDQRKLIEAHTGQQTREQFQKTGDRFVEALERGIIPSSSTDRLRAIAGGLRGAIPGIETSELEIGDADFGRGHNFAAALLLGARAWEQKIPVERLIGKLRERGELRASPLTEFLEDRKNRAVSASDAESGGWLIEEQVASDYIPALYSKSVVLQSGVLTVVMERGMFKFPKQLGSSQMFWVGEGGVITTSEIAGGDITLTARKAGILVPLSNDWLRRADGRANQIVTNDMVRIGALGRDLGYLRGPGSEHQPLGLSNQAGHSVTAATGGTTDLDDAYTDAFACQFRIANSDVMLDRPAWYMSVREEFGLKSLRDGNNHLAFLPEMLQGRWMGAPYYSTTQIPTNLGVGGDESELYFVETSQIIVGIELGIVVQFFDAASYAEGGVDVHGVQTDQSVARLLQLTDIKARHEEAIAVVPDSTRGSGLEA